MEKRTLPVAGLSLPPEVHAAIGSAIEAYALVEGELTFLVASVLKTDWPTAAIKIFSIRNAHVRCEMIGALFTDAYGDKLETFWKSCSEFLDKLAKFRNAIAHWHPYVDIYEEDGTNKVFIKHVLNHPMPGKFFQSLSVEHIKPFVDDCIYIRQQLDDLHRNFLQKRKGTAMPTRFQQPLSHKNTAVLRALQKPKVRTVSKKKSGSHH
jgi:hypothetical protein